MNAFQQATEINNEGVRLLDSGDSSGAILAFQRGVVVLKQFAQFISVGTKTQQPVVGSTKTVVTPLRLAQRTGAKLDGLQNGLCFVYDCPLLLPSPNFKTSACTIEELDKLILTSASFLLFNFGLACHQYGKLSGREASLRKASELYDLTLRMLTRSDMNDSMHAMLKCLALNNLAHLYYEECDYEKSQNCMECMCNLVIWTDCLNSSESLFLTENECDELKLNLMHVHPPSTAPAA